MNMADQEVMKIRAAFDRVKAEMEALKGGLHDINASLDAECYVSAEMIGALDSIVKRYREQASALESIGAELSIPIGKNITEIENAIRLYEQKLSTQYIRNLVLDYFRLTAEAADVKMALEASKRKLIEKCAVEENQLSSAIKPYGAVVAHIRNGAEELSEEDYTLVQKEIGLTIVRAVDRGRLSIDDDADLSGYLDDSCPLLTSLDDRNATVNTSGSEASPAEPIISDANEVENDDSATKEVAGNEEREHTDACDPEPQTQPQSEPMSLENNPADELPNTIPDSVLPGYKGIAAHVSMTITDNTTAASLKAGAYKNLCREKPEAPKTMFWFGLEKLQDEAQFSNSLGEFHVPSLDTIVHLCEQGYLASFALDSSLLSKRYLTLSEKGWSCYTKQEVLEFLSSDLSANKGISRSLIVPEFLRSSVVTWDEQTAISIAFIREFFSKYHRNYQVFLNSHSGLVCADHIADNVTRVCSCIFVEGKEQENLNALQEQLAELQENDTLILVVYAEQDIRILSETMKISSLSVVFSVVEDAYKLLSVQGEDVFVKGISSDAPASEKSEDTHEPSEVLANSEATISPRTPIKNVKIPSEQKLKEVIRSNDRLTLHMFDKLAFVGLESEARVLKALGEGCDNSNILKQIDTLESKGYLSVFPYEGENILVVTPLTDKVIAKPSLHAMLKRLMKPHIPTKPSFVAGNVVKLVDFKAHYDMAKQYLDIIDDLNERKKNLSVLRTGTWLNDRHCFVLNRKMEGQPEKKLRIVSADEYLSSTPDDGEGLICRAETLPILSCTQSDTYYCMCKDLYYWDGSKWIKAVDGTEAPSDLLSLEGNIIGKPEKDEPVPTKPETVPTATGTGEIVADESPNLATADITPEQARNPGEQSSVDDDSTERMRIRQYLDGAWHMVKAGRIDVASVMLKSLVYRDPEIKALADQFAYASGDPALDSRPNSKVLGGVFSMPAGQDAVTDTYAVAAYLRMYFSSAAGDQTYMSRDFTHQKDNLALRKYPVLNDVLHDLSNWVKYQYRGLDAELIELLLRSQDTGIRQRALQQRAQDLLNSHLTESSHSNKRIKRTREILFSSGTDIWKILTGIKDGNSDVRKMAESIAEKGVDQIIDDAWDEATRQLSFARNERCIGVERTTLTRQLRNIVTLITEWLSVNIAESRISNAQTQAAERLIQSLSPKLEAVLGQLSAGSVSASLEQQAAEAILRDAVRQCLDRITGASTQEAQSRDYYISLLKEPLVALDDLDQPHIETPEEEIEPFDFCRRAMEYLDAPERSWEYVLNRIFNETDNRHLGMDYGCAKVIQQYLRECGKEDIWKEEYDIEAAIAEALNPHSDRRNSVAIWERDFTARLEMAEGDNWFETDQSLRSHIQKVIGRQKETYYYADNFGFYGRAMNRLFERLRNRAQSMRSRYNEEFDKLIVGHSEEELSQPIFAQIKDMISNDRFGAAESFMQQVRTGNLAIGNGELTSGTLQDFIDRVNDTLYRYA